MATAMEKVASLEKQLAKAKADAGAEATVDADKLVSQLEHLANSFPAEVRAAIKPLASNLLGSISSRGKGSVSVSPSDITAVAKALPSGKDAALTVGKLASVTGLDTKTVSKALTKIEWKHEGEKRGKKYYV